MKATLSPYLPISLPDSLTISQSHHLPISLPHYLSTSRAKRGFTLIELVIIIVLVGIIGIYIAPKISTEGYKGKTQTTRFMSHIRYAQHKAMVSGGMWGIEITGKSYRLLNNDNATEFPDAESINITVDKSLSITNSELPDNKVYFNFLGQPQTSNGSLLTKDTNFNVNGYTLILTPRAGGIYFQ
nr:prepilin-type N-terminal cleavage/methylation domain-containing protein [Flexistipes sinusarabici]